MSERKAGRAGRGVRPPRQQRSQETMDRILDAADRLLDGDDFAKVPVTAICDEAGVSASSFYARFSSKDALLRCLHERHLARMHDDLIAGLAEADWGGMDTRGIVRALIEVYVQSRAADERIQRTFMLASTSDESFLSRDVELIQQVLGPVSAEFLARHRVDDPDEWTQRFALTAWVVCMAAETGTHAPRRFASRLGLDETQFIDALTDLAMRNLELDHQPENYRSVP